MQAAQSLNWFASKRWPVREVGHNATTLNSFGQLAQVLRFAVAVAS